MQIIQVLVCEKLSTIFGKIPILDICHGVLNTPLVCLHEVLNLFKNIQKTGILKLTKMRENVTLVHVLVSFVIIIDRLFSLG